MKIFAYHNSFHLPCRLISAAVAVVFSLTGILPPPNVRAQGVGASLNLPAPGSMVKLSAGYAPAVIKGIKIYADNPLRFDFIIDTGDSKLEGTALQEESAKLIKYFLAALTVPEEDLWVNLSPYEKDRIIPEQFGVTEMGRDLLAQDYILKQISASLMYPEDELGKTFWEKVYAKAQQLYGTTKIPINTFNKVWIVPQKAVVYQSGDVAFVTESHLQVMLEEDYLSLKENQGNAKFGADKISQDDAGKINNVSSSVVRDVVLPAIEKEVNEGRNFATLRQIYYSMILAAWFKRNLRENVLSKIYVGKNKVDGVDIDDKAAKEKIYQQYLEAFKAGVYNYIRQEYDPEKQKNIKRKYFAGGAQMGDVPKVLLTRMISSEELFKSIGSSPAKMSGMRRVMAFFNPKFKQDKKFLDNDDGLEAVELELGQGSEYTNFSLKFQSRFGSKRKWIIALLGSVSVHALVVGVAGTIKWTSESPPPITPPQVMTVYFPSLPKQTDNAAVADENLANQGAYPNYFKKTGDPHGEFININDPPDVYEQKLKKLAAAFERAQSGREHPDEGPGDIKLPASPRVLELDAPVPNQAYIVDRDNIERINVAEEKGDPFLYVADASIPDGQSFVMKPVGKGENIFYATFQGDHVQGDALDRPGIFAEHPKYKGKVVTPRQQDELLVPKDYLENDQFGKKQPYRSGYNFTAQQLADFYTDAGQEVTADEKTFRDELEQKEIIIKDGEKYVAPKKVVVITGTHSDGYSNGRERSNTIKRHEIGHALYELDLGYMERIKQIFFEILSEDEQKLIRDFIDYFDYEEGTLFTEFAEYFENPDLFMDRLMKLHDEAYVYSPGDVTVPEKSEKAGRISDKMLEHRQSPTWGQYLKEDFKATLGKVVPVLQEAKLDALKRAGIDSSRFEQSSGNFNGVIIPDRGPGLFRQVSVSELLGFEGSRDEIIEKLSQSEKITTEQRGEAQKVLDKYLSTNKLNPKDTFALEYIDKQWSADFRRKKGELSLQQQVEKNIAAAGESQKSDLSFYLEQARIAVAQKEWGPKERLDLAIPVNLGGDSFILRMNIYQSITRVRSEGKESHTAEWAVSIPVEKPNRDKFWGGRAEGFEKGENLLDTYNRAVDELRLLAKERAIDLVSQPTAKVFELEEAVGHIKKFVINQLALERRVDIVKQISFQGELVDLHFVQVRSDGVFTKGDYDTRLAIEIPPKEGEGINGRVLKRLGARVTGDNRALAIEYVWEKLQEEIRLSESSSSPAQVDNVGGIDLNPRQMDFQTQGEGIKFNIPSVDLENLEKFPINGFSPVIFSITPVTNLPLFLGVAEPEKKTQQVSMK